MRLVFLGSPPFATPVLERLLRGPHRVLAVVTRPEKPLGRGLEVRPSRLAELARAREIPLLQPPSARDPAFVAALKELGPDVLLVASYGEIFRRELLELAPHGALNVHASLLPRHRGASPIQAAILAGDRETGVSIQKIVLALDEGDVLLEQRLAIGPEETAGELLDRLALLGGEAAASALDLLEQGHAQFRPQDPAQATYSGKIRKEHGRVDWSNSAAGIARQIRAMTPWPGARTALTGGKEIVLLQGRTAAIPPEARASRPGDILGNGGRLLVACGDVALEVQALKPSGGVRMDGAAWLRGARLPPAARFAS